MSHEQVAHFWCLSVVPMRGSCMPPSFGRPASYVVGYSIFATLIWRYTFSSSRTSSSTSKQVSKGARALVLAHVGTRATVKQWRATNTTRERERERERQQTEMDSQKCRHTISSGLRMPNCMYFTCRRGAEEGEKCVMALKRGEKMQIRDGRPQSAASPVLLQRCSVQHTRANHDLQQEVSEEDKMESELRSRTHTSTCTPVHSHTLTRTYALSHSALVPSTRLRTLTPLGRKISLAVQSTSHCTEKRKRPADINLPNELHLSSSLDVRARESVTAESAGPIDTQRDNRRAHRPISGFGLFDTLR
jgi:hypothetical protein